MNAELSMDSYYPPVAYAKAKPSINLKGIFTRYIYHWPLFLIFILLAVTSAYVYTLYIKPLYLVNAKVLIRDNTTATKEEIALKQLNETQSPKGVETELQLIKSRPIIERIVNDLQLWVTYKQKGKYFDQDLYGFSPVKFVMIKPGGSLANRSIVMVIESEDHFYVLKKDGTRSERFSFKTPLISKFGTWRLNTTPDIKNFVGKTITISLQNPSSVVSAYQSKIKAATPDKTIPVVNLSIEDVVGERGKDILDKLVIEYHIAAAAEKSAAQKTTLDFINSRLRLLSGELNGVEKNVENYKSSRGINDIVTDSKAYFDSYQANDKTINEVDLQLQVIQGIERYVNSGSGYENPPVVVGITDNALNDLIVRLTQAQLDRNKLLATVPEGNPMFATIDKQIKGIRESLKANVAGIKQNLLTIKRQRLSVSSQFESTIKNGPGQERELVGIKRQQAIKENLYVYLLQKREEIGLDYASTIPNASVIEAANYTGVRSSQASLILAMAFILGLTFPAGLLYGRDLISGAIISKNEVINETDAPIIAEIMYDDESTPDMMLHKTRYVLGEQFRNLRTQVNFLNKNVPNGRVTMLTSSIASEGKSFVATNLAVILAASGRKTVILELDMRLPKLSKILHADSDHAGITEFLTNKNSLNSVIQKTSMHPLLDIICTGTIPNNPSELLEGDSMAQLIEILRLDYDEIVIDTPPVHLVTDAMILAHLCDTTLYLVRQAFTPRSELEFINATYHGQKLPNMHIVFNGIQEMGRYSYGYYNNNSSYYTDHAKKGFKPALKKFLKRF